MVLHPIRWLLCPASPVPLGWFRIAVATLLFAKLWWVREGLLDLYGEDGLVPWDITRPRFPGLPHIADLASVLSGFGVDADQTVFAVVALHCLGLLGLLLGVAARWAALLAFCTELLMMHAASGVLYGADYFAHVALTYCVIMPAGAAVSLPMWLAGRRPVPSVAAGLTRRLLQFQLGIVYSVSGFEKARGIQWWNGEAIWRVLSLPAFNQFEIGWLAEAPWLPMLAGWGVVLIECAYVPLLAWPRTRPWWLMLVVGMHLGIGLLMGMWLFGLVMIALSVAAFAPASGLRSAADR